MLVIKITSLLANQMFAYASAKAIALDNGYEFKYIHAHAGIAESRNSSYDKKFGKDFDTIFKIPACEEVAEIPQAIRTVHNEDIYIRKYNSFFHDEVRHVEDNTLLLGHYICPQYFYHRLDEVQKWFAFPDEIEKKVTNEIKEIRSKIGCDRLISVHFRVGTDYKNYGYLICDDYWLNAGERMLERVGKDATFLVFYDRKTKAVEKFIQRFKCIKCHGSLVHDMCAMTKCDGHILSNSTFSMMGALLNKNNPKDVIRPSKYPIGPFNLQNNSFWDDWDIVESKRDKFSWLCGLLQVGRIRNKTINILGRFININKEKKVV